jgi:two-component system, LytTR family, response regulator
MISVLIVDDEPLAREGVTLHLKKEQDVHILAECTNGREAIQLIRDYKPDLVFLDVNMPQMSGFDVVDAICNDAHIPLIIFLTAHENFALKAFDVNAIDYLLKPIIVDRLRISLQKVREKLRDKRIFDSAKILGDMFKDSSVADRTDFTRLTIKSQGRTKFIAVAEILWVEANGDYVDLHTAAKTYLLRETMANLEQQLRLQGFQRIHRSTIVRIQLISEVLTTATGDYFVVLSTGKKLKLSRNYRDILIKQLAS